MPLPPLNLDLLSSTPMDVSVLAAMEQCRTQGQANASSAHSAGVRARSALTQSRKFFQRMIHAAHEDEILFTSGATESANLAIKGVAWTSAAAGKKHIVLSNIEHPSVDESVRFLEGQGFSSTRVEVDGEGRISPELIQEALQPNTCLVAIHQGNYDIGTLQPVAEIARLCREKKVPVFCDASTSGGWVPLDVQALGVDLFSLSPHRFFGPQGTGVLYRRNDAQLQPLIHGGRQEFGLRAGTENVKGIVGAGAAADLAFEKILSRVEKCRSLQKLFLSTLQKDLESWKLNGPEPGPERDPHHLSLSFQHIEAEALALRLDLRGIQVGAGTGCRTRDLKMSPVLKALGIPKEWSLGTILIGLSDSFQEADIERACSEIVLAVSKLRDMSPVWKKGN